MTREIDFRRDEAEWEAEVEAMQDREILCECDYCGGKIYRWENDTLGIVSADGKTAQILCEYCTANNRRIIEDVCETAGLWTIHGWAEDVYDNAQSEINRRILAARKTRRIKVTRRPKEAAHGQRAF